MTSPSGAHLAFDDFDVLLSGDAESPFHAPAEAHLAGCSQCRAELAAQSTLVARLESLPFFSPSLAFADLVLRRVALPDPFALRSLATSRKRLLASRRALVTVSVLLTAVVGTMAASVLWTLANPDAVSSVGTWAGDTASQWLWVALRGGFANIVEQPWLGTAREWFASPLRLALLSLGITLIYVGGLIALRRLMALPRAGAAHA
jgi:hypothetical protein